jgi:hypothetical protein
MSLFYADTAENVVQVQEAEYKRLGKTRRDEDGRVELLLHGARRRLARVALENFFQEPKTVVEMN